MMKEFLNQCLECAYPPTCLCLTSLPPKYRYECFRCGKSTGNHPDEESARNEWNVLNSEKVVLDISGNV